jgi:diacylglycerol kinase (ATP)
MRKAILLYNPLSGNRQERRRSQIEAALAILRGAGVEAGCSPTQSAANAADQARKAVTSGCDTVFACGGDGTIHDVLQGLADTQTALGVIPMGTANALAHDLRLPLTAIGAAQASITAQPRRIAVGRVEYRNLAGEPASRYFMVTTGVGVDAHLFHELDPGIKRRWGMFSYYAQATYLWLTHKMEEFEVAFGPGEPVPRADVTQLLAVRIRNFGGVLRELAPGASLERNDLTAVLFRTKSRLAYLRYVVRGMVGAKWEVSGIERLHSTQLVCQSPHDQATDRHIFVEADGELLGTLPAKISIVPDAITLLVPK